MGFRFRKSFGNKFFRVTFSNKGVSTSAGVPGARVSVSSKGRVTGSAGIPGSGLYYSKSKNISGGNNSSSASQGRAPASGSTSPQQPPKNYNGITILLLIFFFPVGLYFMWAKTNWNKIIKVIITAIFALLFAAAAFSEEADTATMVTALLFSAFCVSVPFWAKPKTPNAADVSSEGMTDDTSPAQATYFENGVKVYINTKTNVCHFSSDCPAYKNANPENKREFTAHSANDLINYEFCGRCAEN